MKSSESLAETPRSSEDDFDSAFTENCENGKEHFELILLKRFSGSTDFESNPSVTFLFTFQMNRLMFFIFVIVFLLLLFDVAIFLRDFCDFHRKEKQFLIRRL